MFPFLEIHVALTVQKPVNEVFEAIVDPAQMSCYFLAASSGPMTEGATVQWRFPEVDMEFPVKVREVKANEYVTFNWNDFEDRESLVEIVLKPLRDDATQVKIKEGTRENDEAGIKWFKENTEGWANFLCCLKAYLEYGINLRKGAFEQEQMPATTPPVKK